MEKPITKEEIIKLIRKNEFNDEIIKYIEEYDLLEYVSFLTITNIKVPKLTALKIKKNRAYIDTLIINNKITDKLINCLESVNFNFDDMALLRKVCYFKVLENSRLRTILYETSNGKQGELAELLELLKTFEKIFINDEVATIVREIIANNYVIDYKGIFDNIELLNFKRLYNQLSEKENKFNKEFNFYHFIKVAEYFANNLELVKELEGHELTDEVINNLALAINNNDQVNYNELVNYQTIYKNKIKQLEGISNYDKLSRLLVGKNSEQLEKFKKCIFDINQILYLQLTFQEDSYEYQLLENYLNIIEALEKAKNSEELSSELLDKFENTFNPNPILNLDVMRENILRLYAKMYQSMSMTYEKLKKQCDSIKIGNITVYRLDNCDFTLFSHNEEFSDDYDFTGYDDTMEEKSNNYICTTFCNEISPYYLKNPTIRDRKIIQFYEFSNPNSLIAFGNTNVYIFHTKKPLITATEHYTNPVDMAFLNYGNMVSTEFDFLRTDEHGNELKQFLPIYNTYEEITRYGTDKEQEVVLFDIEKNKQYVENKFNYFCENISSLNYQELYKLIGLSTIFSLNEQIIQSIIERINELGEKEQRVLNDALHKYKINVDSKKKTH